MDLSVIVPCYNTEHYISKLLDSLKEQDVGNYKVEYIFVNNLCTDNTMQVVKDSGLNAKIRYCGARGCGCARNTGLRYATGKYIWFMDSDDWLLSNTAIKQVLDLAQDKSIVRIRWDSNSFDKLHFSMVWQYCISRELIGDTKFPNIQPCEDDEFMREILAKIGLTWKTFKEIPCPEDRLYYYLYERVGSNMYRYARGEDINV